MSLDLRSVALFVLCLSVMGTSTLACAASTVAAGGGGGEGGSDWTPSRANEGGQASCENVNGSRAGTGGGDPTEGSNGRCGRNPASSTGGAGSASATAVATSSATSGQGGSGSSSSASSVAGVSATSVTSTGQASSSGSGLGTCDSGASGSLLSQSTPAEQAICTACVQCSESDACSNEWQAYRASPHYVGYEICNAACPFDDADCIALCGTLYPEADAAFDDALGCSVCSACRNNCDAAASCR